MPLQARAKLHYFNSTGVLVDEDKAVWYVVRGSIHDAKTDKEVYNANLKTLNS